MVTATPRPPSLLATLSRNRSASSPELLEVGPRQQDQELLAAEPVGQVEGAQLLAQLVGDLLQHDVADGVAARVVDLLEVVEVSDDDPDRTRR